MGEKLPLELPLRLRKVPSYFSAYRICLDLERDIDKGIELSCKPDKAMVCCRILGYLVHHAPSDTARGHVTHEIVSCRDRDTLLDIGKRYFEYYVRLFRSNKGRTPVPSQYVSRPSFDKIVDMTRYMLEEAPQSHTTAKNKALVREGFRCPITREYDRVSAFQNAELTAFIDDSSAVAMPTQCAHIISESTNHFLVQKEYTANVCTTLKLFGFGSLPEELNGPRIHRLENVITLGVPARLLFDDLEIWLVDTDTVNTCTVETNKESFRPPSWNRVVTFTTHDPVNLPVPSPVYLRLHAVCARVAHLSGAAEYISTVLGDTEGMFVLADDGSSASILEYALLSATGTRT